MRRDKLAYSKILAETCKTSQFPPENISISKLLCHNIIQTLVILGNVVDIAVVADGLEVATGTFYLAFLRTPELRTLKVIALRLSHEIDVLDTAFPEGYCPVGIVLAHWRVDIEAIGQLCIDSYLVVRFQLVKDMRTDTAPLK